MYKKKYHRKKRSSTKDTLNIEGAIQLKATGRYGNRKVLYKGLKFDSSMEFLFYCHLLSLQETGEVINIELQPKFLLQEKFRYQGKGIREINYISDFRVLYKNGNTIVWDVKGIKPPEVFLLKWKLVKYLNQDVDFKCVKSVGVKPCTWEVLKI